MTSSPQPCPTCAAPHEICCVAEIMQHQTHSRSPLTHEDMLGRHRSEAGFISSFFPASSPSAETPGLTSRSARSYQNLPVFIGRVLTRTNFFFAEVSFIRRN